MSNGLLYKKTEKITEAGFEILEIVDGKFKGTEWSFSKVSIREEDQRCLLSYEYTLYNNEQLRENVNFERLLGDILVSMIQEQVEKSEVIYHGGSNHIPAEYRGEDERADREDDFREFGRK